jgi:hypothetical protein
MGRCCQTISVNYAEDPAVSKSFQEWLKEGEALYDSAYKQYQAIEAQLEDLDRQLADKKTEVNQIAEIIGKPPVESSRRLTAQIIEPDRSPGPNSAAAIARAITGRSLGR